MASLAGPCSNVVERCTGGDRAPVSGSISAPARTAMVSGLRAGDPLPMTRIALCSAIRELLIVIFRLSLMASLDDSLSADIDRSPPLPASRQRDPPSAWPGSRGDVKHIANS